MEYINNKELSIILKFRLLWNQHAEWTRMAINAITLMLPNEEYEVARLLRNPVDFKNALKSFYCDDISSEFSALLTEHLKLAAEMINAMMDGDYDKAKAIELLWYENGNHIALFLSDINPYWGYDEWRDMFFLHLRYVQDLAVTMISKKYELNIEIYDQLELEAMEMASIMSCGIIQQFPAMFD